MSGSYDTIVGGVGATLTVAGIFDTLQASDDTISFGGAGGPDFLDGVRFEHRGAGGLEALPDRRRQCAHARSRRQNHLIASGDGNSFQSSDDKLYLNGAGGVGDTVTGSGNRIIASGSHIVFTGDSAYMHFDAGSSLNLRRRQRAARRRRVQRRGGRWLGLLDRRHRRQPARPTPSTCRMARPAIGGNANINVTGDGDTFGVYGNAHANLSGAGLFAHCARNVVLTIGGNGETGALDTVTGAFFNVTVGSNANVVLGDVQRRDDARRRRQFRPGAVQQHDHRRKRRHNLDPVGLLEPRPARPERHDHQRRHRPPCSRSPAMSGRRPSPISGPIPAASSISSMASAAMRAPPPPSRR